jgi:ABC-type transport system substrate-binding protein
MKLKGRTIGILGIVAALALAACGGDDVADTPTPRPTAAPPAATSTPANTPEPITIIVAGTPIVVTATPAPTSTPAPTAVTTRKPTGTLNVVDNLGNETMVLRLNPPSMLHYIGDPLVWWDWNTDGPTNDAILKDWSYIENADGSVDWIWNIKPGVAFAKGWGDVTSADIKYTLLDHLKEGTVNANRRTFGQWYGSDPNNLDDSDPLVLKVHQLEKFNYVEQFRVLSAEEGRTLRPMSKAYAETIGEDEFAAAPVYAGAYEFVSQQRGYDILLTAVEDHYRLTPGFANLHYFKVLDLATKVAMLRTGQIDVGTLPGRLAAEVSKAGVPIIVSKNSVEPFVQFGGLFPDNPNYDPDHPWTTETPLEGSAVEVRKALNYAIDREAILDKILFGFGEIGIIPFSFLSPTAGPGGGPPVWWNDAWKPHPFDPALAREIMKDAGHEGCF